VIRPSALSVGEKCALAPRLAEQYPETSAAAERGGVIHREIARALTALRSSNAEPGRAALLGDLSPEAVAAVEWALRTFGHALSQFHVEETLTLSDPETGAMLTEGTPDLVVVSAGELHCIDWKTGDHERVPPVEENMQLMAYAAAASLHYDITPGRAYIVPVQAHIVSVRGGKARHEPGPLWGPDDIWRILDRIRAIQAKEPAAAPGPHCQDCWQRPVCPSYRERAITALSVIQRQPTTELALTDEEASALKERHDMAADVLKQVDLMLKGHVQQGGRVVANGKEWRPQMIPGRKTADVRALEAAGLTQYVREGEPYERWTWVRARRP
jgi:hypothetical protein